MIPILFVARLNYTGYLLLKSMARFPDLLPVVQMSAYHQPVVRIAGLRVTFAYFGWYCAIGVFYLYNVVLILDGDNSA